MCLLQGGCGIDSSCVCWLIWQSLLSTGQHSSDKNNNNIYILLILQGG